MPKDDTFDESIFEDNAQITARKVVKPENRITRPVLTKYERVRIYAERYNQLMNGAKPMIIPAKSMTEKDIAQQELMHKVIPFIIIRTLPNGDIEHWKLSELEIVN